MPTAGKASLIVVLCQLLTGIFIFFYILYLGQSILLPIIYALILAILLNPLTNFFCRRGFNQPLAITAAILIGLATLSLVLYFFITQAAHFGSSLPLLEDKLNQLVASTASWVSKTFKVAPDKITAWIAKTKADGVSDFGSIAETTLVTITGLLTLLVLLPVYIFMLLYYKPLLLEFVARLFPKETHTTVAEVLMKTTRLIQAYLFGLLVEAGIVATLNTIALFALGVPYAFLLGTLGAIINIIPFIGGLISIALPVIVSLATGSPSTALWVVVIYLIIQFTDNHYLVPKIVASKVRINALVSLIVVFIGGALWGIPGMFLAIPLTAILKVIFDRVEGLGALGFLLGDTMPPIGKTILRFKKVKKGV